MSFIGSCYVTHDEKRALIRIGNKKIERIFKYELDKERFFTARFINKATGKNWSANKYREFCIAVKKGKQEVEIENNWDEPKGHLKYESYKVTDLKDGGKRLKVTIRSTQIPIRLHLYQEIYPDCPWTRRWIGVENNGAEPVIISRYDPEILGIPSGLKGFYFSSWRWGSHSFVKDFSGPAGCGVHSVNIKDRVIEAPTVPTDSPLVITDQSEDNFLWFFPEVPIKSVIVREDPRPQLYTSTPWGQIISPGKIVDFSARVVVGMGTGKHQEGFAEFRSYLEKWVIKGNMDYTKAMLVYNTWYGLGLSDTEPSQKSCIKQIDICAELGFDIYVLDAGWHTNLGDWLADPKKFPKGLKVVADYCHQKGLKFGLWVDSRSASDCSDVYRKHPKWAHRRCDGSAFEDSFDGHRMIVMCLGSGYGDYLKKRFVQIANELKLDCLKVDNVCIMSYHNYWSECYATDHNHLAGMSHRTVWDKWTEIMEAVKAARPGIIIESIPSGLSLLDKHHVVWSADYQYRPDWAKEAYFYRALNYHMAYTHPIACIHQGWPSTECADLHLLDLMCASTIGGNIQCGVTGKIERATDEQKAILKKWINWRKANKKYLAVYQHLLEDTPPIPIETCIDDSLMLSVTSRWEPAGIDGFAHLLSDGGWIFLFNPGQASEFYSLTLNLSDYGITDFSAVLNSAGFDHSPTNNTLTINGVLPQGKYLKSWVQTSYPMCIKKIDSEIRAVDWDSRAKELTITTAGMKNQYTAYLTTGGLGRPKVCKNCKVTDYDSGTDTLAISYTFAGAIAGGLQGSLDIRLCWAGKL